MYPSRACEARAREERRRTHGPRGRLLAKEPLTFPPSEQKERNATFFISAGLEEKKHELGLDSDARRRGFAVERPLFYWISCSSGATSCSFHKLFSPDGGAKRQNSSCVPSHFAPDNIFVKHCGLDGSTQADLQSHGNSRAPADERGVNANC